MKVYLDNSATTRVCDAAAGEVLRLMTEEYGNPSSQHELGRRAAQELAAARKKVADAIGAQPQEIVFTSGGTEADNLALIAGAMSARRVGRHLITTAVEHDAVLKTAAELEQRGWEVTYLEPGADGVVTAESLAAALREDTALVSVMLVNNETGAVMPVRAMAETIKRSGSRALLHTDAVQGFLKVPVNVRELCVDMLTLSSHKIHGPKGVGALWVKNGLRLNPIIYGGGQENGLRSGTEALPLIAGFAAACSEGSAGFEASAQRMCELRQHMLSRIAAEIPKAVVIGGGAPHIICVSLPKYRSEVILNYLDGRGVCVSRGSACKKGRRSHVLTAMKLDSRIIDGAVRLSLSRYTSPEQADYAVDCLKAAAEELFPSL